MYVATVRTHTACMVCIDLHNQMNMASTNVTKLLLLKLSRIQCFFNFDLAGHLKGLLTSIKKNGSST